MFACILKTRQKVEQNNMSNAPGTVMHHAIAPSLYLVELQHVEQVKEFAVLLAVLQFGVVLLQTVECKFGLVVHKHFHGLYRKLK